VIKIENLDFSYPRKRQVYKSLNLNIEEGSICGLLCLNGAGKTTLLNLISGFLIPQEGTCSVFGYQSAKRKPEMLQEIFLVGDTSEFPNMSVKEFCDLYAGFYTRFDITLFERCISEFGLTGASSLKMLSFGDKRKVILSFALATKCRLLMFDEPTNGLDIPSKATFRKLIASTLSENQTIIMATHQVRDLANLMDWIVIEHCGKIILNESIDRIAEKLSFGLSPEQIATDNLVYKAESFNQNETVSINMTNQPSQVDIELLFNAATINSKKMSLIFNA
jgi:ABC-2 type transport system ATP-binding protein